MLQICNTSQGKFYELYELDAEIGHKELDWKITMSGVGKCRQVIIFNLITTIPLPFLNFFFFDIPCSISTGWYLGEWD